MLREQGWEDALVTWQLVDSHAALLLLRTKTKKYYSTIQLAQPALSLLLLASCA